MERKPWGLLQIRVCRWKTVTVGFTWVNSGSPGHLDLR